jgi:cell division protein FtsN
MFKGRKLDSLAFEACVFVLVLFVLYATMLSIVHFPAQKQPLAAQVQTIPSTPSPNPTPAQESDPAKTAASSPASASAVASPPEAPVKEGPEEAPAPKPGPKPSEFRSTTSATRYAVDAGLFRDPANASGVVARLPAQFKPQAQITPVKMQSGTLYRVRIIVEDKDEADALAQALLTQQKLQAVVTPVP